MARIAGGGLSTVYLGRRAGDPGQIVALKIVRHDLRKDSEIESMFLDEGRLLARLVHPNIVRTLDVGVAESAAYIAMELVRGVSLAAVLRACAARSPAARPGPILAAWIAARIATALHYAHELRDDDGRPLSIVHRDVNPENVLLSFDGEVKLIDFGLAKAQGRRTTSEPGIVKGKLPYLSPEQIMQHKLDARSDVFGLGTTLWEVLTMARLFVRDTDEATVRAVHRGPIPDPRTNAPEVPPELAAIVMRALERNREHRYPTAAALATDLDAFVQRTATEAPSITLGVLLQGLLPDEHRRQRGWTKPPPSMPVPQRVA